MRTINMRLFAVLLTLFCFFSPVLAAQELNIRPKLPQVHDIRETVQLAKSRQLPILIMFASEECPFCYLLREDFLVPMIISGDYTDKVILREIHVSYGDSMIDFSGKKITTRAFAERYKVRLFPTTVLIDVQGKPIVDNIIGITTPSLFGGTLDDTIDKAFSIVRNNSMAIIQK